MKFLLCFFIFMVLLWQWRQARSPKVRDARKSAVPAVVTMVACAQCGLHLPAHDAIQGKQGPYCSVAHRQAREP